MIMTDKATELIHLTYDGNFQLETDAKVLLCRVINDDKPSNGNSNDDNGTEKTIPVELQLDITTMHPQGGGQPTDIGTITAIVEGGGSNDLMATISKVTIDRATGIVTHAGVISLPNNASLDSDFFHLIQISKSVWIRQIDSFFQNVTLQDM